MDFTQLFLYVPGAIIFLLGGNEVRKARSIRRLGACVTADVTNCTHVVQQDAMKRDVYNYYNVKVDFFNEQTGHMDHQVIRSATEYAEGQQVRLFRPSRNEAPVLMPQQDEAMFNPWVVTIGGALMILLALYTTQNKEIEAMTCLGLVALGAGVSLIYGYYKLKGLGLIAVDAEITEVYKRQISKQTKILKADKFTYYPIVKFEVDGHPNIRRCSTNDSNEKAFKVGDHLQLYYDKKNHKILETPPVKSRLIIGVLLTGVGLLVLVSTVAEIFTRMA